MGNKTSIRRYRAYDKYFKVKLYIIDTYKKSEWISNRHFLKYLVIYNFKSSILFERGTTFALKMIAKSATP